MIKLLKNFLMTEKEEEINWVDYYKAIDNRPPRDTLVKALSEFDREKRKVNGLYANDLGCGPGNETAELLRRGFKVFATDKEKESIKIIRSKFRKFVQNGNLNTKAVSFEDIKMPEADLINASYSLPFCQPDHFENLWNKIYRSLKLNGRFSGNFFGEKDTWVVNKDMTFLTKHNTELLFKNFTIESFEIRDEDGETALGRKKHWHVFSIVARKIK